MHSERAVRIDRSGLWLDGIDMATVPAASPARSRRPAAAHDIVRTVALIGVGVLLAWHLFALCDRYAVNVLFLDHWDYYEAIFTPHSLWQMFDWQHGPHRQGVGMLLTKVVAELTGWDTRAEAFVVAGIIVMTAVPAFALKWRLFHAIDWSDGILLLILLSPLQWGTFIDTPNPAHGALPLLLLLCYCLAWTCEGRVLRYGLVVVLSFLTTFTGFGLFVAPITLGILVRDTVYSRKRLIPSGALVLSMLSTIAFLYHYRFDPATPGFQFPDPQWYLYPKAMVLALANVAGASGVGWWPTTLGSVILVILVAVGVQRGVECFVHQPGNHGLALVVTILISFSLLFDGGMAVGRLSLGVGFAANSRYIPLLSPAFVGLYLHLRSLPSLRLRSVTLVLLAVPFAISAVRPRAVDERTMQWFHDVKAKWKEAYVETDRFDIATRYAGYPIHPRPAETHIKEKLQYLKEHRLNLYHP
jgi:hypothetical protein